MSLDFKKGYLELLDQNLKTFAII